MTAGARGAFAGVAVAKLFRSCGWLWQVRQSGNFFRMPAGCLTWWHWLQFGTVLCLSLWHCTQETLAWRVSVAAICAAAVLWQAPHWVFATVAGYDDVLRLVRPVAGRALRRRHRLGVRLWHWVQAGFLPWTS